jgi:hypothetical protein
LFSDRVRGRAELALLLLPLRHPHSARVRFCILTQGIMRMRGATLTFGQLWLGEIVAQDRADDSAVACAAQKERHCYDWK